ncbi:MAG: oligosaccharide flippase family protein [Actinomycetota bacterium]|nr:oligosaccharide flippase family protein [Actinomycetota bacterium]
MPQVITWPGHLQLARLATLSLGIGIAQVLMALGGVVTAHALGPDGKGVVTAVTTWGQILGWLFLVGLDTTSSVRVAASGGRATSTVISNAVLYTLTVGSVAACASALVLSALLARLGVDARLAAAIGMATIPVEILASVLQSVNVARGKTRQFNIARVTGPCVLVTALLLMWGLIGLTPLRVVVATLGGSVATLLVAGTTLPWRQLKPELRALRSDLHFGFRLLPSGLLGLANARLDLLLMSLAISASQIGMYSVANNAYMPAGLFGAAIAVLITPAVASIMPANTDAGFSAAQSQVRRILRYSRMNLAVTGAVSVVLAALAPVLLPLVFGPAFGPAVLLLWVLIPGNLAKSYAATVAAGANGMRKAWVGNTTEVCGFVATIVLLPALLWRYGVLGAAVASTCSYVASAVAATVSLAIVRRRVEREIRMSVGTSVTRSDTKTG